MFIFSEDKRFYYFKCNYGIVLLNYVALKYHYSVIFVVN